MALLQISEPGQSAAPHEHKHAVGIDLGTTNTLVATVRSGIATTLNDEHDRSLIPSVVHYGGDAISVGYDALPHVQTDSANTLVSVKRMMGRSLGDVQTRYPQLPYRFHKLKMACHKSRRDVVPLIRFKARPIFYGRYASVQKTAWVMCLKRRDHCPSVF